MFKKILFPTDGSDAALRAAELVARLAEPVVDAFVTVVIAIAPFEAAESDLDEEVVRQQNAQITAKARRALEMTSAVFARNRIPYESKIIGGKPVSAAIAQEAERGGYDVIAMGSRGMSMQRDDLHYLGSVTERVIRRVSLPVVVLPVHKAVDKE